MYSIDFIVFIVFSTINFSSTKEPTETPLLEREVAFDMLLWRWLIESLAEGNKTVDIELLSELWLDDE